MYKPELYTLANGLQRRDAEDFTAEFSKEIGNMSGRCIDIGSGPCDATIDFILPKLKSNSSLVCSDISEAMVNYGKKRYGDDDRLSFIKLDIGDPDLCKDLSGQFDHVTSLYCIHWCLDLRQPIENIYRLLRPGGTVFLTFAASNPGLNAFEVLQAMPKYQTYVKGVRQIIPPFQNDEKPSQRVITILADTGFQIQSCSYRAMSYLFETKDSLEKYLLAVNPFETDDMPYDIREEYMRDLIGEFSKREIVLNKDSGGKDDFSTLLRYRVFVVYLKKPLDT